MSTPDHGSTITLPVDAIIFVTAISNPFSDEDSITYTRCRLCNHHFIHYGDDPGGKVAEIVCREHVVSEHGGVLNERPSE